MNDMPEKDLPLEYQMLKAANDRLREDGKKWLWNTLDTICSEISRELSENKGQSPLQVGRQDWQFKVESSTMVGERYGARYRTNTMIIEVGWPRLPEHGFVPAGGLARGRIALSRNVMLEPQILTDLIYKRIGQNDPVWYSMKNNGLGEPISEPVLRRYMKMLLSD